MDRRPSSELDPVRLRTELLRLRSSLQDPVTGLTAYAARMSELRAILDDRRQIGVVHVGMDELDLVETLYGWQVLDGVLARIADVLRDTVGDELPDDARLAIDHVSGDGFIAFLPGTFDGADTDSGFLSERCDAVRARLDAEVAAGEMADLVPQLVFRVGHASLSENPYYRFERRVHAAVAEAGQLSERMRSRRDASFEHELRRIVEDAAVSALLHPVVALDSGAEIGYEALARGPVGSRFERPSSMFSASGKIGMDTALDRVCRAAAFRERRRLSGDPILFVNVLPTSLDDPEWRGEPVDRMLSDANTDRGHVVLEVSERALDGVSERARASVETLRELGFRIGLDDVGTGYSSLETLEQLRPDFVKVDVSLVRSIDRHEIKQKAMRSLVSIASTLGSDVIAEGVETMAEADALRRLGIRLAQGFLFSQLPDGSPREAAP